MIIVNYLIMPKKNLLVTFKGYKDHYLKHPLIVKVVEDKHPQPIDYEINYPMKIKIVFLLRLLRARNSILSWRYLREQSEVLFGTPPQFSLKNFDKWWTLQHKTDVINYPHELLHLKGDDFKALHKGEVDRELIENLGKSMSEYHALDDDDERKKRIKRLLSTDSIIPAPHHYLIMPKKNLLEAIIDYKDDYLKQSMITKIEGNNHERPVDYEIDYPMKIKIVFLLRLVRAINLTSQQSDLQEQVKILFGNPPEFSLKNFDKWWTMQHRPNIIRYPHELLMFTGEDFKALHKSEADRELIDGLEKLMSEYHALDDKSEEKKALRRLILGDLV